MASNAVLEALADLLSPAMESRQKAAGGFQFGYKHDAVGNPISVGYSHGPGGLWTWPGVDPDVFNATMGARSLLGQLPTMPSLYTNPTYEVLTGVSDATGAEPDGVCDDPPMAGLMKACMLTSVFGRYERATQEIEINRLGQRNDRADPMDLRLVGAPISETGIFGGPGGLGMGQDLFTNEAARKFWERNVAFHYLLSRQLWQGNPSNNSANGGYKELTGLETLVSTGNVDAETNTACPAADSILMNFNYGNISSSGGNLVAALTALYYEAKDRAIRMGLMPVRWVFAMRPQLFYEVTAIWPCSYLSYKCNLAGTSATEFIDAQDAVRFRDQMRNGRYLLIDGEQVEVVVDDGISEDTNTTNANVTSGCFSSDIYLLPMSVVGGRSSLYLEYFQYNNPSIQTALGQMVLATIEGPFITWPKQTNLCVSWGSKIEPRLILRTPWLAGRLQNVLYCPILHTRDAFPDQPYYVNGGVTSRSGPSYFNLWSN